MPDPESIGESVAETIADAIEGAQEEIDAAQQTAEEIARAAMETEIGRRMYDLERRMDEWQTPQEEAAQAIAALAMGMTELQGQMSVLLSTQAPPPMQTPQNEEDGQKESHEETEPEIVAVVEPEAETPVPPAPPAPKKKRHRWI